MPGPLGGLQSTPTASLSTATESPSAPPAASTTGPGALFCGSCGERSGAPAQVRRVVRSSSPTAPAAAPPWRPARPRRSSARSGRSWSPVRRPRRLRARAESLDPEDVAAVLRPYHERLREELGRWGGTVEKFIGDAVVAVFGAPISREDDPERAYGPRSRSGTGRTRTARSRCGSPSTRARRSSRSTFGPESGEGFVTGDVVNTASRLQAAAPVNGILVGEQTQRATREVIEYREAEAVIAKGKSEPVPVWEAVQARSRFGVDVRQHGGAPLVGRERELDALTSTLERVKQEREPQLVTLVGVPGIGKSRLVWELFGAIERGETLTYWRQGRSLPYGQGVELLGTRRDGESARGDPRGGRRRRGAREARACRGRGRRGRAGGGSLRASARSSGSKPKEPQVGTSRSPPGVASGSHSPSGIRSCSSSRTSTGPTRGCSTSSSISRSGRAASRSSSCARPGPSCSNAAPAGAAASSTRSRLPCRRSPTTTRPGCWRSSCNAPSSPPRRKRHCSSARAGTRSTPSNSGGSISSAGRWMTCRCPRACTA